jgi:hypothetical protein
MEPEGSQPGSQRLVTGPILSHFNPVLATPILFPLRCILPLSSHWHLYFPSGLFPSGFPTKIVYILFSPICAACPDHLVLFVLIILLILGEEYKLWSSSLCSFFAYHFVIVFLICSINFMWNFLLITRKKVHVQRPLHSYFRVEYSHKFLFALVIVLMWNRLLDYRIIS